MLVIPFPPEEAGDFLNELGLRILNGERFDQEGIRTDILTDNYPIQLIKETFWGVEHVVIVYPDKNGKLPGDEGCQPGFADQLKYLEHQREVYEQNQ